MRRFVAVPLILLASLSGLAHIWGRVRAELGLADPGAHETLGPAEVHSPTPAQVEAAAGRIGTPAPAIRAADADGAVHDLSAILAERPAVLIFIARGCPCSREASPYFERLADAYGDRVAFLGVIDGGPDSARGWARSFGVGYPILPDPDLEIVRAFGVENSAYLALVDRDGTVEAFWPGYSTGMLAEASERIARSLGVEPVAIDAEGAPEELYTGCPYDL